MAESEHYYPDTLKHIQFSSLQSNVPSNLVKTEELTEQLKEITSLYNIAVGVGSSLKFDEVIWQLYKESSRLLDTTNFAIVIYNNDTDTLNFALVFDRGQQLKPLTVKRSESQGLIAHILSSLNPLLVPDLLKTEYTFGQTGQIRSWLGVPILNPLLNQQEPQGVIATWNYKANQFNDRHLWSLSAIGTQAAIAIRNARMYEASQQRLADMARLKDVAQRRVVEMELLNDITRTLSATLHFDEVLLRIMERVEGILKAEAGWLLLSEPKTNDLVFQIGLGRARTLKPFRLPRGQGLAGEVALTGKSVLINVKQGQDSYEELDSIDFPVNQVICVPLTQDGQVVGILEVMNKAGDNFAQSDLDLLNSIVPYAVIAIKNARFHESVLAERDRVIEAEEQARKALARDLHDGATQMVSAILMRLDFCKMLVNKEPAKLAKELEFTQNLANQAIHQIRTLLFELRPLTLESQGLTAALKVFTERRQQEILEVNTKLMLQTKTINRNGELSRMDDKVEGAIFAIVQEAVNNAIKHARANNITVNVEETFASVYTVVSDDGDGFDIDEVMENYEERGSLGMFNIRERAELVGGELQLRSILGKGTKISIRISKAKEERMKKRGTGTLSLPANMEI